MKRNGLIPVLTLMSILVASTVLAGSIAINGSTTVLPIAQKVAES